MSRRRSAVVLLAVVLGGAALLGKACLGGGGSPEGTGPAAGASGDPGASTRSPTAARPRPARAAGSDGGDPAGPTVGFTVGWGGQLGQLGRDRPEEGNPEGPMSLAIDGKGRVLVLDQVNSRIVRHGPDGKPLGAIEAEIRTAQDLAVADDNSLAVMDRFTEKAVSLFDESGQLVGRLPLEGEGVPDPGDMTGVFVDGKDVYAERQHGPLVKLGDTSGNPADPRTEIPGRPSRDGLSFLNAGIIDAPAGRAYVSSIERATMQHRFTRELRLESPILTIVLLDSDRSGVVYVAMILEDGPDEHSIQLTCLDPLKGQPIGTALFTANTMVEETFRDLAVMDEGGVVYALRSESGVTYQHHDCR